MAIYINFITAPYAALVHSMAMLFFYSGLETKGNRWVENVMKGNGIRGLVALLLLMPMLVAGCAGIGERQLMADQVIYEAEVVVKKANTKKAEFDQLVAEYQDTLNACHLQRMHALIDFMQKDVELAEAFFRQRKYYPKGISYQRWQATKHAYDLTRRHLCEMMLATAELEMVFADKEKAGILLDRLLTTFPEEEYAGYRKAAQNRADELGTSSGVKEARVVIETGGAQ